MLLLGLFYYFKRWRWFAIDINLTLDTIKGIGPKIQEELNNCDIYTILDLLLYFPRDYDIAHYSPKLSDAKQDELIYIKVKLISYGKEIRGFKGRNISSGSFSDGETTFIVKWFNQQYLLRSLKLGEEYIFLGKIELKGNAYSMTNPKIIKEQANMDLMIIPKYPLKNKLTNNQIIKYTKEVLTNINIKENLSKRIVDKYKFESLDFAIRNIHKPTTMETLEKAIERLKFQELFAYSLKLFLLKEYFQDNNKGITFNISPELKVLKERLPFKLTDAQSRVIREILLDQKSSSRMNRLLQGDVGSGKTIVAAIAMFNIVKNGYQGAIMAPTEILAKQHFKEFNALYKGFNIKVELLSGSLKALEKKSIKSRLLKGEIDVLIGTHALLEENVEFRNLGMVVTDEQHRFGVVQRSLLLNKGKNVDLLLMTATPIPRTLALFLYGDLDVSFIDELPLGRQKIETFALDIKKANTAYELALKEINKGNQVYVVCPMIEDNEEIDLSSVKSKFESIKKKFKDIKIAMLNGKMPSSEKNVIFEKFQAGEIKLIVSTTVIEVGINIPKATVMIIENAERFGLAQLHQLRGRVGRGIDKAYCFLISNLKNTNNKERLEILTKSNDGFYISEMDLKLRGSGDLFGRKQHGENEFVIADMINDYKIFKLANEEARLVIKSKEAEDVMVKNRIIKALDAKSDLICFN